MVVNFSSAETPGSRFVQQQQFRPAYQCHRDVDQLTHAARKFGDRAVGEIGEAKAPKQIERSVVTALGLRSRLKRERLGFDAGNRHGKVFGGGKFNEQLRNLEGAGDAKPGHATW